MRKTVDNYQQDKDRIVKFLKNNDNELPTPISEFPLGIEWTANLFSEKWKIIIAEVWEEIVGLLWITFWEPSKNYENLEIGYIYLAIFDNKNRRKKAMIIWLFKELLELMQKKWIKTIKFKADVTVEYNNNLYKKFARFVWSQKNTQGIDCNIYQADVYELYKSFFIENNFRPLLEK